MKDTSHPPRLEPIKHTSKRIGVPYSSLRDAHHRGEIPVVKVGKSWYLERADVDRWIESKKERG
jgi:excisionase family DNA binding protein